MKYKDIQEIINISTNKDEEVEIKNGEFVQAEKKSIIEVNKYLNLGWVLLGISYYQNQFGAKIDYYVLGRPSEIRKTEEV